MGRENWFVMGRLKKAVKKINSLLRLNLIKWRISCFLKSASARRRLSLSFNDRLGLHGCIKDEESDERASVRALQRVTSYAADDDVDKRAELFISNFRRQLWLEKQVSFGAKILPNQEFGVGQRLISNTEGMSNQGDYAIANCKRTLEDLSGTKLDSY